MKGQLLIIVLGLLPAVAAGCLSDPAAGDPTPEASCNGVDDDEDGRIDEGFDNLGDPCSIDEGICAGEGVFVCSDDETSTVCRVDNANPPTDNETTCDDVDNDCDGDIDEGCDDDGDGWCDANFAVEGEPAVCSSGGGDCDDEDETVNPDGQAACDGRDNDCDGDVDELSEAEQPVNGLSLDRAPSGEPAFPIVAAASNSGYCIVDKVAPTSELIFLDAGLDEVGRADLEGAFTVTHPVTLRNGGCAALYQVDATTPGVAIRVGPGGEVSDLALSDDYTVTRRRTLLEAPDGTLVGSLADASDMTAIVTVGPDFGVSSYIDTNIDADSELQLFEIDGAIYGVKGVQEFVTVDLQQRDVILGATTGPLFDAGGVVLGTSSAAGSGYVVRYEGGDMMGRTFEMKTPPRTTALDSASISHDGFIFPSDFVEAGSEGHIYSFVPGASTLYVRSQEGESPVPFDHNEVADLLLTIRHSASGVDLLHVIDRGAVDGTINLSLSRFLCH